ncbi:YcaO-like family protein [Pseudalkalibacillus berkeleyi]|uniref:YcaO-like family protein n=1 Tax=Pseudalkalibacillus berkeleyi TaxID=1069813 RepID=A0ABS9GXH3_9BACL|nr:YcaO-like family protein [Pseudalkalibacillus berkeleyi]MCF6136516.1 YcaO-like family protein [Pseudalkalibacillus berkeleyi]
MEIEFQNESSCSSSLLSRVSIRRPIFSNEIKSCKLTPNLHEGTSGRSVGYSIDKVIKASFGEHLERLSLFKSKLKPDGFDQKQFDAFNLITGETIKVPAAEVLLEYNLPIFKDYEKIETLYSDTCGVAAHLNSKDAMLNGFMEFVERQSLIQTWLTKRIGERVTTEVITDQKIHKSLQHLNKYVDEIQMFNISISKNIYVILTLGFHKESFSIGIDADTDLEKAVRGSINEFAMILEGSILIRQQSAEEQSFHDSQLYTEIFYQLSGEAFRNKFDFLFDSPHLVKQSETKEQTFNSLVECVSKEFKIPIYCTFIPSFIESGSEKVVKIFSSDGYPHMNTELFEPEDYKISQSFPHNGFPNKGIHIPFP